MGKNWIKEIIDDREITFFRYRTQTGNLDGIEYFATTNPDGTFNIDTHEAAMCNIPVYRNIPYAGEFENYREMDEYADWLENTHQDGEGFVCHVAHNAEHDYVFFTPGCGRSYYISTQE